MVDMVDTVDTVVTVDTTADTTDTSEARGTLMANLRRRFNLDLRLMLGTHIMDIPPPIMDTTDTMAIPTDTDTDTIALARDPLMLNPKPRLIISIHLVVELLDTQDTDTTADMVDTTVDTMVDTVDITGV